MKAQKRAEQIEFDVFSKEKQPYAYLSEAEKKSQSDSPNVNIIFSPQTVIVVFICMVLLLISSFVLGVEKGKLLSKREDKIELGLAAVPVAEAKPGIKEAKPSITVSVKPATELKRPQKAKIPAQTQKGGYTIQVASLKSKKSAQALSESLTKQGLYSFSRRSGDYMIVLAGRFQKKEDAKLALKTLKKTFNDCFIKEI